MAQTFSGTFGSLGGTTKTTFLAIESDKLSFEFVASAVVRRGQPVKLDAAGQVLPWVKTDGIWKLIGYSYSDGAIGDTMTIFTRGFILMYGISLAALPPGPCAYSTYDSATVVAISSGGTATGWNVYDVAVDDTQANAWNLDNAAAASAFIRLLLMD